ncbi:HNH endonuclease [Salinicoccus sp. ID82-1]|uniref:HNH endonuclease n=1 Tax=Salinicoccus sp. ID82-1 TaxID=2820269 RepID=UPI001F22498A|nr:HNH endonuclease [Salinicoccus sp. ID82-1]MCG1009238.1 HNH endonuclease [Salinicoccus sp. ID82-1]
MSFKRSYLEVLIDDSHIEDIEEEILKSEWFLRGYDPESETQNMIASRWLEQLTIMMISKRSTEEQKDRCYRIQEKILEKHDYFEEVRKARRSIPTVVKKAVKKRYKNQCAACKSKNNLHFHHIVRFADGGEHSVDNLILLCHECHAEEHKGERGGSLLKGGLSTHINDTRDSVWDIK